VDVLGIGEVEEELLDRAVPGEQLGDLRVQVPAVLGHVARLRPGGLVVAQRMQPVDRELRVVPVDERVIHAHAETALPEGLGDRSDQVALPRRRRDREVGVLVRLPQAEALVVLRGHDDVPHPGVRGEAGPLRGVEQVRLEVLEVLLILGVGRPLPVPHPLVAGRRRVQPPVDEHPEASLPHPVDGGGTQAAVVHRAVVQPVVRGRGGHLIAPFAMSPMNCRAPNRKTTRRGTVARSAPAMIIP
jgi:hypothetical protein